MTQSYIKDINIVLLYNKEKEDYIKTLEDKFSNINSVIIENDNIFLKKGILIYKVLKNLQQQN